MGERKEAEGSKRAMSDTAAERYPMMEGGREGRRRVDR